MKRSAYMAIAIGLCCVGAWPIWVGRVSPWSISLLVAATAGVAAVASGRSRASPVPPLAVAVIYGAGLRRRPAIDRWVVAEALLLLLITEVVAWTDESVAAVPPAWRRRAAVLGVEVCVGAGAAALCAIAPSAGPAGLAALGSAAVAIGVLVVAVGGGRPPAEPG